MCRVAENLLLPVTNTNGVREEDTLPSNQPKYFIAGVQWGRTQLTLHNTVTSLFSCQAPACISHHFFKHTFFFPPHSICTRSSGSRNDPPAAVDVLPITEDISLILPSPFCPYGACAMLAIGYHSSLQIRRHNVCCKCTIAHAAHSLRD